MNVCRSESENRRKASMGRISAAPLMPLPSAWFGDSEGESRRFSYRSARPLSAAWHGSLSDVWPTSGWGCRFKRETSLLFDAYQDAATKRSLESNRHDVICIAERYVARCDTSRANFHANRDTHWRLLTASPLGISAGNGMSRNCHRCLNEDWWYSFPPSFPAETAAQPAAARQRCSSHGLTLSARQNPCGRSGSLFSSGIGWLALIVRRSWPLADRQDTHVTLDASDSFNSYPRHRSSGQQMTGFYFLVFHFSVVLVSLFNLVSYMFLVVHINTKILICKFFYFIYLFDSI